MSNRLFQPTKPRFRASSAEQDLNAFVATLAERFGEMLERAPVAIEPAELGLEEATARPGEGR